MKETKKGEKDGYVVIEAAVLLPLTSILILLVVYLCSYLYQGCFMVQASYAAAFRGSRYPDEGEEYVHRQLDELLEGEILTFQKEERLVKTGALSVQVSLEKETPFARLGGKNGRLSASWTAAVRDPVAYIRGIRIVKELKDGNE